MEIVQSIIPQSKWALKCPYYMNPTRIVVHNTANDASAKNEISYMTNNDQQTSFHYAVDDIQAIQAIYEDHNAWHAGDGGDGIGNRQGIAIEICYSKSGGDRFTKAEQNAVELIVDILRRYNWTIKQVTKHQDYSGKYCPHRTLDLGWVRFLDMVNKKLNEGNEMITQNQLNVLARFRMGRVPTTTENTNYVGKFTFDQIDATFMNSAEYKALPDKAKAGMDVLPYTTQAIRDNYVAKPAPVCPTYIKVTDLYIKQ